MTNWTWSQKWRSHVTDRSRMQQEGSEDLDYQSISQPSPTLTLTGIMVCWACCCCYAPVPSAVNCFHSSSCVPTTRATSCLLGRLGLLLPFTAAEPLATPVTCFSDKPWPWVHYHLVGCVIKQLLKGPCFATRMIASVGCNGIWLRNNRLMSRGGWTNTSPFHLLPYTDCGEGGFLSIQSTGVLIHDAPQAKSPCGLLHSM